MKKTHLINSLKIAITALKDDTIFYDWSKHSSCNCGVVSQAVLNKTVSEVDEMTKEFKSILDSKKIKTYWRNGVKHLCSITGKSNIAIFNELQQVGMSLSDITHLEYLSNKAILKRSGIKTEEEIITEDEVETSKEIKETIVPHRNFFFRLFGFREILTDVKIKYDTVSTVSKKPIEDYYQNKENLILYLIAWVEILEEGSKNNSPKNAIELETELLNAVAEEDYEYAASLRDSLSMIKETGV